MRQRLPKKALHKKVKYKKRKKRKAVHERGFSAGHEYDDFPALPEEERAVVTKCDTVVGRKSDGRCILSIHRKDLHFQIYLLLGERPRRR